MQMSGVSLLFACRLRVGGTENPPVRSNRAAWATAIVGSTSGKKYCGVLAMACSPELESKTKLKRLLRLNTGGWLQEYHSWNNLAFDPGRASAPRVAVPHMLPSSEIETLGPRDI
jgi:hypothetical protein